MVWNSYHYKTLPLTFMKLFSVLWNFFSHFYEIIPLTITKLCLFSHCYKIINFKQITWQFSWRKSWNRIRKRGKLKMPSLRNRIQRYNRCHVSSGQMTKTIFRRRALRSASYNRWDSGQVKPCGWSFGNDYGHNEDKAGKGESFSAWFTTRYLFHVRSASLSTREARPSKCMLCCRGHSDLIIIIAGLNGCG